MNQFGINSKTRVWISTFLKNCKNLFASVTPLFNRAPCWGPLWSYSFINDIVDALNCHLRLPIGTVLHGKSKTNHQVSLTNLAQLFDWTLYPQVRLDISKCHLLCITKKRQPSEYLHLDPVVQNPITTNPRLNLQPMVLFSTLQRTI